ncbi:toll/interleukin-1 receptor domain-containing protein [Massilia sp. SM-13]|uniref:toll/interleukin-1 receptor domain-containing protein n=1 Tax=Pseudoduganella rhizocola TaxID=3382643 RepID=UPI0038B54174
MSQESRIRIISLLFLITSFVAMAMSTRISGFLGAHTLFSYFAIATALVGAGLSIYVSRRSQQLRQGRVYIMYSHADRAAASNLVQKLKAEGYNPWFDEDEIAPGQKIHESIQNGLSQSAVALLLVSQQLNLDNALIDKELSYALQSVKPADTSFSPVIPVRLDDADIPAALAGISWIDLREPNAFERLNQSLRRILAHPRLA